MPMFYGWKLLAGLSTIYFLAIGLTFSGVGVVLPPMVEAFGWSRGQVGFGFALIALSQQRKLAALYAALVVFNIAMNLLFIPRHGALAAAWATVATEAIAMLSASYIVHTKIGFTFPVVSTLLAGVSALAAAYVGTIFPSYVHIGFRLSIVAVLYIGIGYTLGLWNKGTLRMLREVSTI